MISPSKGQRGGAGKKRIDTTSLIEDTAARQVTFSKRRNTLFTMASDLAALCGALTFVVTFSFACGIAYAFGSPSVDAVFQQLLTSSDNPLPVVKEEEEDAARVAAMRQELQDTKALVEAEKARMKTVVAGVDRAKEAAETTHWWEADVNTLGAVELPEFEAALGRLMGAIKRHVEVQLQAEHNNTTTAGRVDVLLQADQNATSGH